MATVKELRVQAKARKIPRYYSLSKSQLMYSLGINGQSARPLGDARARSTAKKHGIARSFAAEKIGEKLGDGDETKKAAIKKRIVKSVSKELKAHAKKIGRELTIEEKRSVAVKALASEVRAIRSGVPEQKQRRKPVAERKAAQNQRHDAIDKDLNVKRQKVHEKAVASGKSEAEAAQVAYQTVKPRSIVREALAKKQAEQDAIAAEADAKKGKKKSKSEDAPLNDRDLKKAIYQLQRRKGGALASIGGRMERTEKNEAKNESKQAEAKESKLKPQEAIDHKHSNPSPTDAHVDGWLKDTALRVGKPSAANIQKATIEQLGNQHNLQTKGIKTLDAMTSAIHAKMTGSNPKASISDAKAIVGKAHKTRTERANADYKAIQDGDEAAIYRVGRSEALKLPGLASDHRSTIKAHLARTFSKSGGDSKALGLKPGADFTVAELKNAYRSASMKAHPDRGGSVEKFHALKESYDRMLPKAKSPAIDKVAEQTGMTREEVAKAVKRRTAKGTR